MSSPRDVTLRCAGCGREFTFSADAQAFYRERGAEPPRRCSQCGHAPQWRSGGGKRGKKGGKKGGEK